jgi:hypothetical protein
MKSNFPSAALRMALWGLVFLPRWATALDAVAIGQGGELDWKGAGTGAVAVIDAEHRSPLNPNNLLVGNAPGDLVEFARQDWPRSILPRRIAEGENVATGTVARGGEIRAPNVFDFTGTFKPLDLEMALKEIIASDPGGEQLAFERKNANALGILVILNLGARFGVNRIRFFPRNTVVPSPSTPFQNDFLRAFELFTNDGLDLTREGTQVWEPLVAETDNKNPVVEITLEPPRYVQSIRLRATSPVDFEIDELEVFGQGFLSQAQYLSDIFDAGQPAVWGALRWTEAVLGDPRFSGLQIRTRTGADATPFVFTRKLTGKQDAEELSLSLDNPGREMGLAEYKSLPKTDALGRQWEAGPVKDDLVNWSPFSTPYPAGAANGPGLPIVSPSPRRYMQFQVLFNSDDLEAARVLTSLSFDLLTPPFADDLVGEVFPREVEVSRTIPFVFAVRAAMKTAGLRGFDTIEIATPIRVEGIDAVELFDAGDRPVASRQFAGLDDTTQVDGFRIEAVAEDRFAVRFPLVQQDGSLVRIRFRAGVLTYSTNFTAAVRLSGESGAAQTIAPGDAVSLGEQDDPAFSGTTVLSTSLLEQGRLLAQARVVPSLFTPNGDGVNDRVAVQYNLLSLSAPRPVEIAVYDLSGRRVRLLHQGPEANGRYEDKVWDGRDQAGKWVPPGLYLVRIAVEGDSRQEEESRAVGVVY